MNRKELLIRLLHYFATYTNKSGFATVDGMIFHEKADAQAHASGTLKIADVGEFTRDAVPDLQKALEEIKAEEKTDGTVIPEAEAEEDEMLEHTVTDADLEENPELKDQGIKAGDEVEIPVSKKAVKKAVKKA